jgi:hypothetical protein
MPREIVLAIGATEMILSRFKIYSLYRMLVLVSPRKSSQAFLSSKFGITGSLEASIRYLNINLNVLNQGFLRNIVILWANEPENEQV